MKTLFPFILCFIFGSPLQLYSKDFDLPVGFRAPVESDYPKSMVSSLGKLPFKIQKDLNGDGIEDTALLLIKSDNKELRLVTFMSSDVGTHKLFILDSHEITNQHLLMGISEVQPGSHRTACGKGYWECKDDEPPVLELEQTGIRYFQFESSSSIFYWDAKSKSFKRIWISD